MSRKSVAQTPINLEKKNEAIFTNNSTSSFSNSGEGSSSSGADCDTECKSPVLAFSDALKNSSSTSIIIANTNNNNVTASFDPCVPGVTISQEREFLRIIRERSLDISEASRLSEKMTMHEFAFAYVRTDRTRRKNYIKRSKDRAKARLQNLNSTQ